MKSKWSDLRAKAVQFRRGGLSIREIENRLKVPRSTLSGWFSSIELLPEQKRKLANNCKQALINARKKAIIWHHEQKGERIEEARQRALKTLSNINIFSPEVQELALAILYMAEGRKAAEETSLGSSDPLMLRFFLRTLKKLYSIDVSKISCELYLRADQNDEEIKKFWSKELGLPLGKFTQIYKDNRTVGSKTYADYKGVCSIRCGNIAIKRKLLYLSQFFCENIVGV